MTETLLPFLQGVCLNQLLYLLFILVLLLVALIVLLGSVANREHAGGPAYAFEILGRSGYEP